MLALPKLLKSQFAEIAENQPELLARHCTEAGLTEKAAGLWGKAGQRSLERSALVEAIEQFTRALDQIAALPATPALRREEIKLQAALITALVHVKGYAAPEAKAAVERARLLIEQAEALGEPPEDPLLLFRVVFGSWVTSVAAFNGDMMRELAAQLLALAEKQGTTVSLMMAHRVLGMTLMYTGDIAESRAHYDQALPFYDPAAHRPLATFFGVDIRVVTLSFRSLALWMLGYPEAALADAQHALKDAREIGQAATLMLALFRASFAVGFCGNYAAAKALSDELVALADQTSSPYWKSLGMLRQGWLLALDGKAADAVQVITSSLTANRPMRTLEHPSFLPPLALAHAEVGQFDDAWRSIDEALTLIKKSKERWFEAEVNRIAGEIALKSPQPDAGKAQAYFERALAVARQAASKVLGTARSNEHGAALARSGQAG